MSPLSARHPSSLPSPAILHRRCEALGRLDALLDDDDVPTHAFDRRSQVFWLREAEGNHVQITFGARGVVILGFHHESPMSPVHHHEQTWPGVVDELPTPLGRVLRNYPFGVDVTFCIWRLAGQRTWHSGQIRRPRGRDVDGSVRLLAMLDGNARRYQRFARSVHEVEVSEQAIKRAFAGRPITRAEVITPATARAAQKAPPRSRSKPRFAVGDRVIDRWDGPGKVTAMWRSLDEAAAAGEIDDVSGWLAGLAKKPKTPRRANWYSVRPSSGGSMLAGELDLRHAT